MKKFQKTMFAIAAIAFYIGAVFFFVENNIAAGIMGTFAGTVMLAALLMDLRKQK